MDAAGRDGLEFATEEPRVLPTDEIDGDNVVLHEYDFAPVGYPGVQYVSRRLLTTDEREELAADFLRLMEILRDLPHDAQES